MTRQHGVWSALLLTLAACYWVTIQEYAQENEVIESAKLQPAQKYIYRRVNKVIDNSLSGHLNDKKLMLRSIDSTITSNLFSSFETVEEEALAGAENQATSLPTNPYSYAGKITENGDWMVFLTDGTKNFAVKTGDVLESG